MKAVYSKLHKAWIVQRPDRPELILASGHTKEAAETKARAKQEDVK